MCFIYTYTYTYIMTTVVRDESMFEYCFSPNYFMNVVGNTGSGKTTFMRLAMFNPKTDPRIKVVFCKPQNVEYWKPLANQVYTSMNESINLLKNNFKPMTIVIDDMLDDLKEHYNLKTYAYACWLDIFVNFRQLNIDIMMCSYTIKDIPPAIRNNFTHLAYAKTYLSFDNVCKCCTTSMQEPFTFLVESKKDNVQYLAKVAI